MLSAPSGLAEITLISTYDFLLQNSYQSMVVVSSGAVVGNLIAIFTIDRLGRRNIQLNGFFWLYILIIIIGTSFCHPEQRTDSSALVVYISLCQIFNFGAFFSSYLRLD
jgi:PHS family inorganic phosphate transporter-like MFS transporter